MKIITQDKTNWMFLLIVFILALIFITVIFYLSQKIPSYQPLENNVSQRVGNEVSDTKFLKESPLFSNYESFDFGPSRVATIIVEDGSYYGPPHDPELYQIGLLNDESCQTNQDSYCGHLFAKSRTVNLSKYLGQKIQISYRPINGIIMGEQQFVIIDSVVKEFTEDETSVNGLSEEDLKYDLKEHPELIPYSGVLGGKMFFVKDTISVLTDKWILASFEDGHIGGYMLLEYTVMEEGKILWRVIDSYLD